MTTPIARAIRQLAEARPLGEGLTRDAFRQVMCGEATSAQTAALLMGLRVAGETAEELTGAVHALRQAMNRVEPRDRRHLIDTCGTGGGAVPTFNISTAAALVAVGAGATVAKHGNRSYTSQSGSADVLEALGTPVTVEEAGAADLLEQVGMAFLFAPAFHPAMRHVAPVRRELAVPTIMNMIGPLANPASVTRQVMGVGDGRQGVLLADAARRLEADHALVVYGEVGMDEIAPQGTTRIWEVRLGEVRSWTLEPADVGLAEEVCSGLRGGTPEENAARIEALLEAPYRDPPARAAVLLNAGAAVYVAGLETTLPHAVGRAEAALDDGQAASVLSRLREAGGVSTSA